MYGLADNIQISKLRIRQISMSSKNSEPSQQKSLQVASETALIEEYKSCDELSKHIDKMIWQLASVVFPIALAGFAVFGLISTHTSDQFFVVVPLAIGSMALLIIWDKLSDQWADYQKLTYIRMREIETVLGLWHYRYAYFIRDSEKKRKKNIQQVGEEEKKRFMKLSDAFGEFRHFGYSRSRQIITGIFVLGWIALIIREFILTFLV